MSTHAELRKRIADYLCNQFIGTPGSLPAGECQSEADWILNEVFRDIVVPSEDMVARCTVKPHMALAYRAVWDAMLGGSSLVRPEQ